MLPLQDVIDLEQNDGMLEDDDAQPRRQIRNASTRNTCFCCYCKTLKTNQRIYCLLDRRGWVTAKFL